MEKIRILIDENIPFVKGVLEPYAQVTYKNGSGICREDVLEADALIVRTRTICDASLLEGSPVKFIATATIGTDHIDTDWCASHGILVRSAAGCNAGGVMNYVFSALYATASRHSISLDGAVMGIIGVGNVGKRVEHFAKYLGFKVLKCDPPRAENEGPEDFCSLETLLEGSDIVTLHTPLNDSTRLMAGEQFFASMKKGAVFINASRGEVVDEDALLKAAPSLGPVIIDTWAGEPDVNLKLLEAADIATPHIAGYSYQGKQNATAAAVRALSRFFGFEPLYEFFPSGDLIDFETIKLDLRGMGQGEIASVLQYNYPIFTDDFLFRSSPGDFEKLRSEYKYRREFYVD